MIERNRFNSIVCYCHTSILSVCFWLNQRRTIVGNQSIHWIDSNGRDGSPSRCWIFVSASVRFGTFQWQKNITEDQVRRYVEGFYNDRACVICYNAYIREWLSKPCDLKNFIVAIGIRDCKCYELIRAREKSQQYSSSSD